MYMINRQIVVFSSDSYGSRQCIGYLKGLGLRPVVLDMEIEPWAKQWLDAYAPGCTAPQVFVAGKHVGDHLKITAYDAPTIRKMLEGTG
jgi:hypothetical protein